MQIRVTRLFFADKTTQNDVSLIDKVLPFGSFRCPALIYLDNNNVIALKVIRLIIGFGLAFLQVDSDVLLSQARMVIAI